MNGAHMTIFHGQSSGRVDERATCHPGHMPLIAGPQLRGTGGTLISVGQIIETVTTRKPQIFRLRFASLKMTASVV